MIKHGMGDIFGDAIDLVAKVPIAGAGIVSGVFSGDPQAGLSAELANFSAASDAAQGDYSGVVSRLFEAPGGAGVPDAAPTNPSELAWYDPRRYLPPPAPRRSSAPSDLRRAAAMSLDASSARAVARQLAEEAAARGDVVRGGAGGGAFEPGGIGRTLVGVAVVGGALYLAHRFMLRGAR